MSDSTERDPREYNTYWRWLEKRVGDTNTPQAILQRRTMNTVCHILSTVKNIPFDKLSSTLYFFCVDLESKEFAKQFESQMELAGANPDRFAKGLHKFYNEMSAKIKKENLYADFFDFVSLCARLRYQYPKQNMNKKVVDCYLSLLLQLLDYIRPNKFDFSVVVCGMKISGELISVKDYLPYMDVPTYVIEKKIRNNEIRFHDQLLKEIVKEFKKFGYSQIQTADDLEEANNRNRIFNNHIAILLPFINEYTFDIFPKNYFFAYNLPFNSIHVDINSDLLIEKLHHRTSTLPSNGVLFRFENQSLLREVVMKEMLYDEKIYMLYRLDTVLGDLSGYFDTKDDFLISVLLDAYDRKTYDNIRDLLLYMYACLVTRDGPDMLKSMAENCYYFSDDGTRTSLAVEVFGKGGKIRNVLDSDDSDYHRIRKDDEKYVEEERTIQGFIRKVGVGRKPSEQAVEYAKALGYDLAPDETYVRPFVRRVLRLKEIENV